MQSIPLLHAVCKWASGRWPVRALFASEKHFDLVREEKLQLTPFFVHHIRDDFRGLLRLWKELAWKSDLIVCAPEMSEAKLALLKLATGARYAVGEASPPSSWLLTNSVEKSWSAPFLTTQDQIVSFLGIATPLDPPTIHLQPNERAWAKEELSREGLQDGQPLAGIQCSSVVTSKCWPALNFGTVARMLAKQHPSLVLISFGATDERADAEIARAAAGDVAWLEATGRWTIRESLAMLRLCDLFISGDTGLMHMAAAVGTRTVSIFGPTSTSRRAPSHNDGIALCPCTPCHPCFRGRWNPCDCISTITPAEVFAAAEKCLTAIDSVAIQN